MFENIMKFFKKEKKKKIKAQLIQEKQQKKDYI